MNVEFDNICEDINEKKKEHQVRLKAIAVVIRTWSSNE
jgi:hypothetical protein